MKHAKRIFTIAAVYGLGAIFAPQLWAESAAKTGEASDFLAATGSFDPHAGGTKIDGTLSVVYEKEQRLDPNCTLLPQFCMKPFVTNMHIALTLDQGNLRVPFTTDYLNGARPHAEGFFLNTQVEEQARTVLALIQQKVIPFFFSCEASCPPFKIKALTNFQYTTGHDGLRPFPNSGGFSADVSIAVQ